MKRVIIVQARMTSTRLPGKVLMDLAGRPMLAHQLRRLKLCQNVDDVVVATTTNHSDDPVVALADAEEVRWFRGSEQDVLLRYLGAARDSGAELVIRVTADCPLIAPEVTDRVIADVEDNYAACDYASNVIHRTYPRGLDTEAFFVDVLERVARLGCSPLAREHVTNFILRERPELFVVRSVCDMDDNSDLRWTVDTEDDMALVRQICIGLSMGEQVPSYRDTLAYVRKHPNLSAFNSHVQQKSN